MASLLLRSIRYLVTCDDKDQLLELSLIHI